jgi:hypothetical protein
MKKILETIHNFEINDNTMLIKCKKYNIVLPIKNGSIVANIANELKENIGINEININDNIIIFYRDINDTNIKPIKIIKLFNYKFNDESSDNNSDNNSDDNFDNI